MITLKPMRTTFIALAIGGTLVAQVRGGTALDALRALPQAQMKNLALIEGRDGVPDPEAWHVLVQDPKAENGYREFVVSGSDVAGPRTVSQFAETLKPEDIIGIDAVKVDSDQLTRLALLFATANNFTIGRVNYELKKGEGQTGAVWKISCWDEKGTNLAEMTVTANKGEIVSHPGFKNAPGKNPPEKIAEKLPAKQPGTQVETVDPTVETVKVSTPARKREKPGPVAAVGRTLSKFFTGSKKKDDN